MFISFTNKNTWKFGRIWNDCTLFQIQMCMVSKTTVHGFKYDMIDLVNFYPINQKSGNFFSMFSFCQSIQGLS